MIQRDTPHCCNGDVRIVKIKDSYLRRILIGAIAACTVTSSSLSAVTATDEAETYLDKIEKKIMATRKIPAKSDGLKVTLRYNLARNGSVSFVRVEKCSGNQSFDDSAVQAVRRAFHA